MNKVISVIVPVFNTEKHLQKCIESIINQTYSELEIILVNDGSSDSSLEICNKYAESDKRIIVIDKINGGAASARNAGLEISTGDYVGFVDSDDYINLSMYELLLEAIKETDCKMSKSLLLPIQKRAYLEVVSGNEKLFLVSIGEVSVCNSLFERDLVNQVRFEEGSSYEDTIFMFSILKIVESVAILNKSLYAYCTHKDTTTTTPLKNKDLVKIDLYEDLEKYYSINLDKNKDYVRYISKGKRISLFDLIIKIANYGYEDSLNSNKVHEVIKSLHRLYKYKIMEIILYTGISLNKKIQMIIFSVSPKIYFQFKKKYNFLRGDIK